MLFSAKIELLFVFVTAFLNESRCFCEESYVVICDNLLDIKTNETWTWRYLLIGSDEYKSNPPNETLDSGVLLKLTQVKSLTIINQIRMVKPIHVSKIIVNLEYLNLYDNDVGSIEDFTFNNFPKLHELFLENNQIQHLGRSVFRNTSLEIVSLSRNRLESITTCFLESTIKWIKLNHNKLTYIKARAFPTTLERLELDHNLLSTLEDKVFENLLNLKELSIRHNRLTSLPNISFLKRVQFLHFASNKIGIVDYSFNQHERVEYVDLSFNLIRNISIDGISWDKSPPIIVLSFNRLHDLKFNNPEKITDLVLYGNPWNCDCLFKIEKTLKDYHHLTICQEDFSNKFREGKFPTCIENGKCGEKDIEDAVLNNFVNIVNQGNIKNPCEFRL